MKMHWLRSLFSRFPWDNDDTQRRLQPLRFRVFEEADLSFCEELHEENEAFGIPAQHRGSYRAALKNDDMLTLIVEEGRERVGSCGIQCVDDGLVWLCYGLVHPSRHRMGIGTTMLMARIALLPTEWPDATIAIAALDTSLPYYRRFGFQPLKKFTHDDGHEFTVAVLTGVGSAMIEHCQAMLSRAGAMIPQIALKKPNQSLQPTGASRRG